MPMPLSMPSKRKRAGDAVYFKAYVAGEFRKLSNLFGTVEWDFQRVKFREGSEVHKYMTEMRNNDWDFVRFSEELARIDKNAKAKSYVHADGEPATGLIAKLLSIIARGPDDESDIARRRLGVICQRQFTKPEFFEWRRANVKPELSNEEKDALMHELLTQKFAIPKYRELLLRTDNAVLHEAKGRGAPNRYEWQKKELSEEDVAKGYTQGGDVLGRLMMHVREEMQGQLE